MTLETVMTRHVVSVGMDATVEEVQTIFERYRFHHVIVTEGRRAVGVISDRDLLKTISPFVGKMAERPQDVASLKRKAHQIMSRTLTWATAQTPLAEAAMLILNRRVSCLPVLDEHGVCVGIVTWRDMLRWSIKQGLACEADAPPEDQARDAA